MRRALIFLCPGLLLLGCDKPGSLGSSSNEPASTAQVTRLRHAQREQAPDPPAELRRILEAAAKIESAADRDKAIADVAWNAIEIDPDLACEAFLQLLAGSPERLRLIRHYSMRLAEQNPDEALDWAASLETEQEIAAAQSQIALTIAETDPHRAADLLSESGIVGREFDVAVVQVVQRWAAQSPADAAAWVILFPPGGARQAGVTIIAGQWLPRDAPGAFDWLDTLQDVGLRKETARAMEGVILQQPQDIRDEWLQHVDGRIQSELEQQREQAIKDVGDNLPPLTK